MRKTVYRPDIDGLRTVAVMAVLFFHAGFGFLPGGFIGVDVFFVISGFLITRLILNEVEFSQKFSFSNFYERRARRLLPALFFVFAACFIAGYTIFTPLDFKNFSQSLIFATISLSNIYFWNDSGYWNLENVRPLLHTWSLSVEEQFYLIWPFTLVVAARKWSSIGIFVLSAIILLVSFSLNLILPDDPSALFYLTHFRLFELAIGACLVWLTRLKPISGPSCELVTLSGLGLILYSAIYFHEGILFPSYNALYPCVGAAMVIYGGQGLVGRIVLANRVFVWIGLRSYSLYLAHWPLIVFYSYWVLRPILVIEKIAIVVGSLLIAAFMYRYIESPFRGKDKLGKNWTSIRVGLASSSLALLIMLPAGAAWLGNGWPWRLGEERLAVIQGVAENAIDPYSPFSGTRYGGDKCTLPCFFAKEGRTEIALVGRSHAQHYINGLLAEGRSLVFHHVNCPIFFGDYCNNDEWATPEELTNRNKILDRIKMERQTVLISEVLRYSRDSCVKNVVTNKIECWNSEQDWLNFIGRQIADFRKDFRDFHIVWIGETPRVGRKFDSLECLTRPYIPDNCFVSPLETSSAWMELNKKLEKIAKKNDIAFFNPHDYLCNSRGCNNFIGGMPVYADSHHFSDYASVYLGKYLSDLVADKRPVSIKEAYYPTMHIEQTQDSYKFSLQPKSDGYAVAFYLYKDKKRIDSRWYSSNFEYEFQTKPLDEGRYRVRFFITKASNPDKGGDRGWKRTGYSDWIEIRH